MVNRAERRARDKQRRKGIPAQYDQTNGRGRGGMIDEYTLQERSRRLQEHEHGQWKPTSNVTQQQAQLERAKRRTQVADGTWESVRKILSIFAWTVILLSALAFFIVMWLPHRPVWLVLVVSVLFALGVIGLFFIAGNAQRNPRLDEHGTAL